MVAPDPATALEAAEYLRHRSGRCPDPLGDLPAPVLLVPLRKHDAADLERYGGDSPVASRVSPALPVVFHRVGHLIVLRSIMRALMNFQRFDVAVNSNAWPAYSGTFALMTFQASMLAPAVA